MLVCAEKWKKRTEYKLWGREWLEKCRQQAWPILQIVNRLWRGVDHNTMVYSFLHHSLVSSLMHIGYCSFHCLSCFARDRVNMLKVVGDRVVIYIVIYNVKNYSLKVNTATITQYFPSQPSQCCLTGSGKNSISCQDSSLGHPVK